LVAGVTTDDVFVDQAKKRIVARAKPLPGATIASYYALEKRMADRDPEWRFIIEPPAMALPQVQLDENGAIAANDPDYALAIWAIKRVNAPVGIIGDQQYSEAIMARLAQNGVKASYSGDDNVAGNIISFRWLAPDSVTE
jgi:hypothetical protein